MKKLIYLMLLAVGVSSCSVEERPSNDVLEVNLTMEDGIVTHYFRDFDRYVTVSNDGVTLSITFTAEGDGEDLVNSRLHIVDHPSEFPITPGGTLPRGQMEYFTNHGGGVDTFTYNFNIADEGYGDCIYIAAHAIFKAGAGTTEHFAGDLGTGKWNYFVYGDCEEIIDQFCESAFMMGSHTFYNMRNGKPFLNLGNNRWGWTQQISVGDTYEAPIYAAAGQNNIDKGKFVGTATVTNVGNDVHVTIDWADDTYFNLVHIYAGPSQPTTTAPGQFGYTAETPSEDDVYIIENAASGSSYWIILHAETCWFE